ncbi:hypothetical protein AAC387_Pa02g3535 [Persea americana]
MIAHVVKSGGQWLEAHIGIFQFMSSMTVKMRAILLVWVGLFLLGANGIDIAREEYLKYKKYLKLVNKPAVKSIKTKYGDIFDCVDIYKQHAFDNPLLKNHTIPNTHIPFQNWNRSLSSLQGQKLAKLRAILDGGCPDGSVPIRRIRMQDVLRAPSLYLEGKEYAGNVTYAGDSVHPQVDLANHHWAAASLGHGQYYGTKAALSVWNPQPLHREMFSLSQIWLTAGPYETLNSIEIGWMVYERLFGDRKTRLFTFWTGDGYKPPLCYNTICPGFVHTNPLVPLGAPVEHISQVDGQHYSITVQVLQDATFGDWLFLWEEGDIAVGYFPKRLFPILGNSPATKVVWGGETYNPFRYLPMPPMGSGHFPSEAPGKASYVSRIRVVDTNRHLIDAPFDLETIADVPQCYGIEDPRVNYGGEAGRSIFYGGPGC